MTNHPNLKILLFVGATGSGKSTAIHFLTEKGFPKVAVDETDEKIAAEKVIDQVHHLAAAGQHRIIIDDVASLDEYRVLKHAFPGEMITVAIERENKNDADSVADHTIPNKGSLEDLYEKLDALVHEIEF